MEKHADYVSVKFLLKQVYAAHTTTVKELESEIADLKQKLEEKKLETQSTCEKCKQMELAYSACKEEYKNAILEQTRRLQDFEERFSTVEKSKSTRVESPERKIKEIQDTTVDETLLVSPSDNFFSKFEEPILEPPKSHPSKLQPNVHTKLTVVSSHPVKILDESAADTENAVLVPDTLDTLFDGSFHVAPKEKPRKTKEGNNCNGKLNKENVIDPLDNSNGSSPRRNLSRKRALSELKLNEVETIKKSNVQDKNPALMKKNDDNVGICTLHTSNTTDRVKRTKCLQDSSIRWAENFKDFDQNPTTKQEMMLIKDDTTIFNEIDDDFVITDSEGNSTWKTSVKKKHSKKLQLLKAMKSSSRFTLTLDAPTADKKTFKQTKLSSSIFVSAKKSQKTVDSSHSEDVSNDRYQSGSMVDASRLASLAGETTCSSFRQDAASQLSTSGGSETFCSLQLVAHCKSSGKSSDTATRLPPEKDIVLVDSADEDLDQENDDVPNSFDRIPVPDEPNFKYKDEPVRNRAKRQQLDAFDCKECEKYYTELGISNEEKKERMKSCSRHRAKHIPPATPEHFWEIDFPDTEQCKARGYVADTQKVKLKSRRRRPLNNE